MSEKRHAGLGIHSLHPDQPPQPVRRRPAMRRAKIIAVVIVLLLALGGARTMISRNSQARALESSTAEHARNFVMTVQPTAAGGTQKLELPGTLQGYVESPIYARSSGYVARWYKNIGSRVEKGDLLAEIESPEIDQQLSQAMAAREQTASSLDLAKSSAARWESLRSRDAVSQQELDERRSANSQAQANLAAADANVRRLKDLESFKRVVAPFAGLVTRRNVDVGDLIDAGNGGAGRSLFTLAQTDPLRVYVNVPQAYAYVVKAGMDVTVALDEMPGKVFHGTVARTSGAIDVATRTMQTEIALPNHDGKLLPGAYARVRLPPAPDASAALVVPVNTLLFRAEGPRAAVVGPGGRVQLRPVTVGRDFGTSLEILSGLTANDVLVLNPADSLADGTLVQVAPPASTPAAAPAAAPATRAAPGKS
jgi:RND family efflux transporter MFP subunit